MINNNKALIIGSNGFIGLHLQKYFKKFCNVKTISRKNADYNFDIVNKNKLRKTIDIFDPDIIIYTAAVVDIEIAEVNKNYTNLINTQTPIFISKIIKKTVKLVYFSSIAVYPDIKGPHSENNTGPLNHYGKSKLLGENIIRNHFNSLVLRFSVIGFSKTKNRKTLTDYIFNSLSKNNKIEMYIDEQFNPLHVNSLVIICFRLIKMNVRGIYNLGSARGTDKHTYAIKLANYLNLNYKNIISSNSNKNNKRVLRAKDCRLDCKKLVDKLRLKLPSIDEEIKKIWIK